MIIKIWHKGKHVGTIRTASPILSVPRFSSFSTIDDALYIKIPTISNDQYVDVSCVSDTVILDLESPNQYIIVGASVEVYTKSNPDLITHLTPKDEND